jgi:antitoxin VapB
MSVNIKNREVEALLAEIKAATGKGASRVVLDLLRKEVAQLRRQRQVAERRRQVERISRRYRARLKRKPAPPDEIIGYDEHGLPR